MQNENKQNLDILEFLDNEILEQTKKELESIELIYSQKIEKKQLNLNKITKSINNIKLVFINIYNLFKFILKYLITSSFIFIFLLGITNYSAYISIAKSYIYKQDIQKEEQGLISSVKASYENETIINENTNSNIEKKIIKGNSHSIQELIKGGDFNLNIEISPYENRIIIPKIGKNIPLIDIKNKKISGKSELNNIFMEELENGVIRYPGSAKPGEQGNTFIFGHSSNFPWIDGDYNDVFALLDNVIYDDEIIVYYGQKKYIYKIKEKRVIKPGDVSVLKKDPLDSEITLMTCWPIGTTLNRLILVGDLVNGTGSNL